MLGKNRILNFYFLKDVLLLLCFSLSVSIFRHKTEVSMFNKVNTVRGLLVPRSSNVLAVVRDPSS